MTLRIERLFCIALCVVTWAMLPLAEARAKADPKARTVALLAAFKQVVPTPEDGSALSAADKAKNKKAFAALDTFFDFETMTSIPLKPHHKKFSSAQEKNFKHTFAGLIRLVAYPDAGSFLQRSENTIGNARVKGNTAEVDMDVSLEEEDLEMKVTFYWQKSGEWKLVDTGFDGARLSKDYSNQFGRIIAKSGVDGLIAKLNKRLKKEGK